MGAKRKSLHRRTFLFGCRFGLLLLAGSLPLPFLLYLGIAGCERRPLPSEKSDATVVALVNGRPLLKRDFEFILPEDYERVLTAEEKEAYLDRWITTELLYEAALKNGYKVTRDIEVRLDQQKKELLADRFLQEIIQARAVVSEAEVKAYYEANEYQYTKEFRVSHILVNTPEDAQDVLEQLKSKSFSWVARRQSIDKHTGIGGDLGYLSKGNMIPEFEEVVFGMEVGETSDVIESEFGYHIIMLTSIRDARNKLEYEDAKDEIANILMRQKRQAIYDSVVNELKQDAAIDILDEALGWTMEQATDTLTESP
ncbi:MAG: hypothetical protein GTO51_02930 [Candidatus Latescibacteria bacterium]|nr:hypothetical protein [Candidatus Latescibacterota bacterium]NIM22638.1 hypothetical protein [Candidatus Latescibacterota bacterium]NIM64927.1 hypothetical protein [Candidatus Latescibacterota bacterium]NIO01442.1 hypothetical protein [Candidatus Latescibacterota bacterium]NIO27952.1 hypothetical protein [Candidatus Latescibacterota bacterium]